MGKSAVKRRTRLLVGRFGLQGWSVVDDRHGFSLWLLFFSIVYEREVRAFFYFDPLEVLDFFPQVRAFELRCIEVCVETFVLVLQLVEKDPRAVFDDESGRGVDIEVGVVGVVQTDLGDWSVPDGR